MGFMESIGMIAILFTGVYLLLRYLDYKVKSNDVITELEKNNDKCQDLIRRYNRSVIAGSPNMSFRELKKQLRKILRDPKEKQASIENIKRNQENKEKFNQKLRDNRKIGYKYEIEIFEIFDINRELTKKQLLLGIQSKLNVNSVKAEELLEIWNENSLIEICPWNPKMFEVGIVLNSEQLNLDKNDLTRKKWLNQHKKTLKRQSHDYFAYIKRINSSF
ncbi:MAG: hypothetical protein KAT68_19240 [Bacteroidales bacterium]|nr:hypothetical protein [Bacteroidales bacterium]